jgi:hypothetical protein
MGGSATCCVPRCFGDSAALQSARPILGDGAPDWAVVRHLAHGRSAARSLWLHTNDFSTVRDE